jgi:ABC-2 type transport system ATP-binding protein
MTEPGIRIGDLRVVRSGVTVLPGLTCDVSSGSVTGLLGPSGSGKSTLIPAIVGVQRVAAGVVDVLGLRAGSAPLRGRIGYMTQAVVVPDPAVDPGRAAHSGPSHAGRLGRTWP